MKSVVYEATPYDMRWNEYEQKRILIPLREQNQKRVHTTANISYLLGLTDCASNQFNREANSRTPLLIHKDHTH